MSTKVVRIVQQPEFEDGTYGIQVVNGPLHIIDRQGAESLCGSVSAWGTLGEGQNPEYDCYRIDLRDVSNQDICTECVELGHGVDIVTELPGQVQDGGSDKETQQLINMMGE